MTAPRTDSTSTPWRTTSPDEVKARIASVLAPLPTITIGEITLFPHQADAVLRLRTAIRDFHGALLADDVGLGKTFVALALAAAYREVHVIAPAALLPMWQQAIARTGSTHVQLHSLHAFSQPVPPANAHAQTTTALVIIDEAHHLRARTTRRYHAVAAFVARQTVLLMSATPLHNAARELQHLLALFAGGRRDLLRPDVLARVVVRRTNTSPQQRMPLVRVHPPDDIPHDRATLNAILALPAPLAAHNGAVAGALIRLGLLRAWCSSDAALAHALRRRLLRGEALRQALLAGRHPSTTELRAWLVGDHEVQLAFPELMADAKVENGDALDILKRHLDALLALEAQHCRTAAGDVVRAERLRDIVRQHPGVPVVAFSQFAQTVHALFRALADIAGVGSLSGTHARIASGKVTRGHVLASFAPIAQGRPPPPSHQAIRLLLTTDLLAEGVNLQDAGIVVHCDLPWTDALRAQRVGRCARIGSLFDVVEVFQLGPPTSGAHVLRLAERLARKAGLAERLVGAAGETVGADRHQRVRQQASAADAASLVDARLRLWRRAAHVAHETHKAHETHVSRVTHVVTGADSDVMVGAVAAQCSGFIAVLTSPRPHQPSLLLAHLEGWRLPRTDAPALLRVLELIDVRGDEAHATLPEEAQATLPEAVTNAQRRIEQWYNAQRVRVMLGDAPRSLSVEQRLATRQLSAATGELSPLRRAQLQHVIASAERAIRATRSAGAQRELRAWAIAGRSDIESWLRACPMFAESGAEHAECDVTLAALLVLVPGVKLPA